MPAKKTFHQAAEQKNFLAQYGVNGPLDKQERKQSSPPVKPRGETIFFTDFYHKSFTDFLIIFANLRKCWKGLLYQAFPAFCVSEDTPHIMAFRSLTWR